MPSFSDKSIERLSSCHYLLQQVCNIVIVRYDITVLCGYRSHFDQERMFAEGKSKLRGGQSKHNADPSLAVDVAPWPIDWEDTNRFYLMAGFMFSAAAARGVKLRWGGDWDMDWEHTDQTFNDLPHFELVL